MTAASSLVPSPPGQLKPVENKFPKGPIGPKFVNRFMPWVEKFWHENKRYPSVTDFAQKFGFTEQQIMIVNSSKFWLLALERRGISRPDFPEHHLSDKQVAAVAIMSNFSDQRNAMARLAEIGVTEEILQGWYSNPHFKRYFEKRAEDAFANVAPVATVQLAKKIEQGNFQAIKFYYEITGQAQSPEVVNVKQAMQVLIEAVQKHVKDPAVLEAIAREVQTVRGLHEVN